VPLFDPRHLKWLVHFRWSDDSLLIVGTTPVGRATVVALQLNRIQVQNVRQALRVMGLHPPEQS
jgi:hypothetical protein